MVGFGAALDVIYLTPSASLSPPAAQFLVLNKQKDEYQAEIKRTVVEARRKGRDPLGRAMRQAEADVLKAKSEKILAGDGK